MKKGWAKIVNLESQRTTRKYHYFREGMALCGKYMLEGGDGFLEDTPVHHFTEKYCYKCLELFSVG